MGRQIKAIIFDLDGTLINTIDTYESIFLKLCEISGSDGTTADFHQLIGMPVKTAVIRLFKEKKVNLKALWYLIFNLKKLKRRIHENASLYPDALMVLSSLSRQYKLAVTTSSKRVGFDYFNNKFQFTEYVDVVVTQNDVKQKKPHPEPYLKTAGLLGVLPEQCLVIEDAPAGSTASNRAEMKTIVVLHTAKRERFEGESAPEAFITNLSELTEDYISGLS